MSSIRRAQSYACDTLTAAEAFYQGVIQPDLSLVVFFCSSDYDLEILTQAFNRWFAGVPVIGCTTAGGSYGPDGYQQNSISGVSFARSACQAVTAFTEVIPSFDAPATQEMVRKMRQELSAQASWIQSVNTFALQLIDGLSGREELVSRTIQNALGAVHLVGGSAGDSMRFCKTHVFCDGQFRSGGVALAIIASRLPFHLFKTQHFTPLADRMVVTRADASQRIVFELNGLPAAAEYARSVGVEPGQLSADLFSHIPVVVKIGGEPYVRSIQQVLPGGALKFYCAMEEGVVLHLGASGDLEQGLQALFDQIGYEIAGSPQLVIGCDCILRRLEIEQQQLSSRVDRICISNNLTGFSTYGEQYRGAHINQTLSGVAFGYRHGEEDDDHHE